MVESTGRHDIAVLPRQSGKTSGAALRAVHVAMKETSRLVTYATKTRRNAKRIFWRPLLEWAGKCGVDTAAGANHSELTLKVLHEDGSHCLIELLGLHDLDQLELLRGTQYDLIIIDEAGFIRAIILESFLTEVAEPGIRVRRGTILLIGTPGPIKLGPFYEAYVSGKWRQFRWTAYDNPATPPGSIEEEIEQLGLKPDDPRYIREYLAEWCDGLDDAMVWQYTAGRDDTDVVLPTRHDQPGFESWRYSWGIDIASAHDNDAIVVLGWNTKDGNRRLYEVDTWQTSGREIVDELERHVRATKERWQPCMAMGDTGGHGATKILNTFAAKLGIIFQKKSTDVEATVRLMNTDFRTGRLKLRRDGALAQDMRMELWEVSKTGKRELGGQHSDLTAAARYAYAAAKAHRSLADPVPETDPTILHNLQIRAHLDAMEKRRTMGRYRYGKAG